MRRCAPPPRAPCAGYDRPVRIACVLLLVVALARAGETAALLSDREADRKAAAAKVHGDAELRRSVVAELARLAREHPRARPTCHARSVA